jgi:outer membrane lipoprotein carrier protein
MMKYVLMIAGILSFSAYNFAQTNNQMTSAADSDPQARAVLDKMRQKYEGYSSVQASFKLDINFPEQPVETQNIQVKQQDAKYRVDMPGRTIISDGSAIWMILHNNKEVQISPVPEDGGDMGIMSPQSLFRIYESDEFVYAVAGQTTEDGKAVQQIEFKPIDEFSDYSKLRMTLYKSDASFKRVTAFGKDGSRFTLNLEAFTANPNLTATTFVFNKADYPDYYVEDLR